MKKKSLLSLMAVLFSVVVFNGVAHAITRDEAEAKCRDYAKEDGVSPAEMKSYLAACMDSLMANGRD